MKKPWLFLLVLAFSSAVQAEQGTNDDRNWSEVTRLSAATKVEVIHSGLKRSVGTLIAASNDAIRINTDTGSRLIPRAEVKRVTIASRSRRKRLILGLAIGAGAAAIATLITANAGDIDIRYDYLIGGAAVLGAGAGAGIGAMLGGPKTVYRAP
ncbi:MAG: hypothetical protein H7039_00510 [Bryobacteraceae bacterium]|nr:hypothetical protein [Bryobacteraceae bacterium]